MTPAGVAACNASFAAVLAAEPLPAALVLAALDRAAAELQPDPDYYYYF